ncbi:MAG: hypothetical protein ACU0FO_09165 [Pseudooceanicola nanhaiensis]|uniref:hypothetical protein n=1 Tax=Pseudooceanicola nanhaiensis TaxID=375761 RepID=UPI004058E95B
MSAADEYDELRREIDAATALIRGTPGAMRPDASVPALPLQSLLDQLQQARDRSQTSSPVRLFKHFACTGGTIMSKCLAAMPNSVLLSEMDPLSVNHMTTPSRFAPSDLIKQMRYSRHGISDELAADIFRAGLKSLHKALTRSGSRLILRDHCHSQYCTEADWRARPSLEQIVTRDHPVLNLISVRHPIESFLSLRNNKWVQFSPDTLEEYARRYLAFLDDNASCPIVYYEDFVDTPETVLENMCRSLDLAYEPGGADLVMAIDLSGDSGRSGDEITARPTREIPEDLAEEAETGTAYKDLCRHLRYPLLPGGAAI